MSNYKSEVDKELDSVCKLLELSVIRTWSTKGSQHDFAVRLSDLPSPIGMEIQVSDNYLVWNFETVLDSFALPTVELSRKVFSERKEAILEYCEQVRKASSKFSFEVNQENIWDLNADDQWDEFKITMSRPYDNLDASMRVLRHGLLDLLTLLDSLSRDEALVEMDFGSAIEYREEGALRIESCRKYERSRFNREMCLNYFGYKCHACGQSMREIYGEVGSKVIHVHHVTPVSEMPEARVLNPITELVPLCPNCHNVAHRRLPPYTVAEIQGFLSNHS